MKKIIVFCAVFIVCTSAYAENKKTLSLMGGLNINIISHTDISNANPYSESSHFNFAKNGGVFFGVDYEKTFQLLFSFSQSYSKFHPYYSDATAKSYSYEPKISLYWLFGDYKIKPYIAAIMSMSFIDNETYDAVIPFYGASFGGEYSITTNVFSKIGIEYLFAPPKDLPYTPDYESKSLNLNLSLGYRF